VKVAQLNVSRASLRFYVALTGLFGKDVPRAGIDSKAAVQSIGVDIAGTGGKLGVVANAIDRDVA
jgi:hypothetical protein